MRNVSEKLCRENHGTFFVSNIFIEDLDDYEKMWQKIRVGQATDYSMAHAH
jgi:hypothetical protein